MKKEIEYQIYIGCNDSQTDKEIVSLEELKKLVTEFFSKKETGFSLIATKGGYLHDDGNYAYEDTLCISIIGEQGLDVIKLGKSLSMYMNQECIMVLKCPLDMEYR